MQRYCFFLAYANNSELFCNFTPNFWEHYQTLRNFISKHCGTRNLAYAKAHATAGTALA